MKREGRKWDLFAPRPSPFVALLSARHRSAAPLFGGMQLCYRALQFASFPPKSPVMDQFARTIIGYHGCRKDFAAELLLGNLPINQWKLSQNDWDWLGHGIYFWEHSPQRALRWAREHYGESADVLGAVIQLGRCFDLLDESNTKTLADNFENVVRLFADEARKLPSNRGRGWKRRNLDCLVINYTLDRSKEQGLQHDTVRAAFLEGDPLYPKAGFSRETHIQVAVRNPGCILGVFRPNLIV